MEIKCRALTPAELAAYEPSEGFLALRQMLGSANSSHQNPIRLFVFRVAFTNTAATEITVTTNAKYQFERFALQIESRKTGRVRPKPGIQIRLSRDAIRSKTLEPTQSWELDLVGERVGSDLIFLGATFSLTEDEEYTARINYGGATSNTCRFSLES